MTLVELTTDFLPCARADEATVQRQIALFEGAPPHLALMLGVISDAIVVLNPERQIVYANAAMETLTGIPKEMLYGQRFGEALACLRATERPGGCGTSEFCRTCGAGQALAAALNGKPDARECHILRAPDGEALELRVQAEPVVVEGEQFTVFAAANISGERRRALLEKTFFHDIMNTAGGLRMAAHALSRAGGTRPDLLDLINQLTDELIDELQRQRELAAAESGELTVRPADLDGAALLNEVAAAYTRAANSAHCRLVVEADAPVPFRSDRTLLRRVLGNMVKNAIEASGRGDVVRLACRPTEEGGAEFQVHNPAFMPRHVQLQVFQRSFSTKDVSRGLGTYSMFLLTNRYLNGEIGFTSEAGQGTFFTARYPAAF